jgi:hypothetical protein
VAETDGPIAHASGAQIAHDYDYEDKYENEYEHEYEYERVRERVRAVEARMAPLSLSL